MTEQDSESPIRGMGIKTIISLLLTTGVISSLLTVTATLYVTSRNNLTTKEIEESRQRHELVVSRFNKLTEYRYQIAKTLDKLPFQDTIQAATDDKVALRVILQFADILKELDDLFQKHAPFFDRDIREQLETKKQKVLELNRDVLRIAASNSADKEVVLREKLKEFLTAGVSFTEALKSSVETQLQRFGAVGG